MIEMRTFEGDAKELSEFTQRVWLESYGGKLLIPLWSPKFFEWQLFDDIFAARDFMVAAYDGTRLVGLLPCQPVQFDLYGETYNCSITSWQSVDGAYRRQGISKAMLVEQVRRHLEFDMDFGIGFPLGGSIGTDFWEDGTEAGTIQKLGFWFRVLDHRAVGEWETSRWAGVGARALGLVQGSNFSPADGVAVRPYEPDDLDRCLDLVHEMQREADLCVHWTKDRLARQLSYQDLPRTLVAVRDGSVAGFVNYHLTEFRGRTTVPNATIDLIVFGSLPSSCRLDLLKAAFHDMKESGAALATAPHLPCYPWRDMVRAGCMPFPGVVRIDYYLGAAKVSFDNVKRVFIYCR